MKLEVKDAHVGWSKESVVQRYVNFSVQSGEVCCVLGPNGCGKTTLFRSVLGLMPFLSGKCTVDGEDVAKWSPKQFADVMAYVSQSHKPPFPYIVRDVILLGRINKVGTLGQPTVHDRQVVETIIEEMGISHLADKHYTDISGGELQLVMIARALAQEPQILVLDEPTAALDYGNVVRVIDKVRELAAKGYAVIMTTHSPDHAFMCHSNVVLLQPDRPAKFGSATDIITEKNMRDAYGIGVRIVEFVDENNEVMRMCAPVLKKNAPKEGAQGRSDESAQTPVTGAHVVKHAGGTKQRMAKGSRAW